MPMSWCSARTSNADAAGQRGGEHGGSVSMISARHRGGRLSDDREVVPRAEAIETPAVHSLMPAHTSVTPEKPIGS
jgi:hypothetical protein